MVRAMDPDAELEAEIEERSGDEPELMDGENAIEVGEAIDLGLWSDRL
jgi:hypothetical protein